MSSSSFLRLAKTTDLPHVWQVDSLGQEEAVLSTGYESLDGCLPGGGWPVGSLIELLQARAGQHVWRLLLPALAQAVARHCGPVVLVGAPFQPFGPSLGAQGLSAQHLLWVRADKPAARLWAAEQALRCADVAAVLAWLPQCKSAELRRLHLASQLHGRLLFAMRGLQAAAESSPSRLRLQLDGVDTMRLRILKRRGPPLEKALDLPAHNDRLAALLARPRRTETPQPDASGPVLWLPERLHALDRPVAHT